MLFHLLPALDRYNHLPPVRTFPRWRRRIISKQRQPMDTLLLRRPETNLHLLRNSAYHKLTVRLSHLERRILPSLRDMHLGLHTLLYLSQILRNHRNSRTLVGTKRRSIVTWTILTPRMKRRQKKEGLVTRTSCFVLTTRFIDLRLVTF